MTQSNPDTVFITNGSATESYPTDGQGLLPRAGAGAADQADKPDLHVYVAGAEASELASPEAKVNGNGNISPVQKRRDSLRRTSSKIANLRAAFEKSDGPTPDAPRRRFDRSPAGCQEHESELAALKQKLEKEEALRQAIEEKCASLEEGMEELQSKLDSRELVWQMEMEDRSKEWMHERERATAEASNAQRQLSDLKRSISTATRIEAQIVTDSTFVQEFELLHHEVQNFVVNQYRRTNADATAEDLVSRFEKLAGAEHMPNAQSVLATFDPVSKIPVYQAFVNSYLMVIFNEPLLFGLPHDDDWPKSIRRTADDLPIILTSAAFNKWRAITLDAIRQSEIIKDSVELAAVELAKTICAAMDMITVSEMSDSRIVSLTAIVQRVISLSHLFRVQRAHYEFVLPSPGTLFHPATMEDVLDDGDSSNGRPVRCAVFPSVVKLGDEEGDNVSKLSNVVVKAKVLCSE